MALDQIWKQQLALVAYGNEFLSQELSFQHWIKHSAFYQHLFLFRDLNTQHLLAQHFQIWLEGLQRNGVHRISLHNSNLLLDEKNPNPNVELIPLAHFFVSHHRHGKTAWICGKELAEWYISENEYVAPAGQQLDARVETFWRFELSAHHAHKVELDLQQPDWDEIKVYTDHEIFNHPLAQDLPAVESGTRYYAQATNAEVHNDSVNLPLLPKEYAAPYANETLLRLEQLKKHLIQKKKQLLESETTESLEQENNIRLFQQKLDDITAKFVTKVANHYKTARLTEPLTASPFESDLLSVPARQHVSNKTYPPAAGSGNKGNVFTLILITLIICFCAYYFGL